MLPEDIKKTIKDQKKTKKQKKCATMLKSAI